LRDQTPKRQTHVLFISNLEHSVQDVLAQAKRSLHHDGIEKGGLLEGKLTSTRLKPKVSLHNLC
jgi:hypothetical protein